MSSEDIRFAIKEAVAKVCKIDPNLIDDAAALHEDLGLDSLAILETIVEVQRRFNIPDVPDDEYSAIRTIEQGVQFVQKHACLEVG